MNPSDLVTALEIRFEKVCRLSGRDIEAGSTVGSILRIFVLFCYRLDAKNVNECENEKHR